MSAASAQSTVTISGGYGLAFGKSTLGDADSGLQIARQTGNIAFKGTEDLGGGLKANFELQTSIGAVATTNTDFDNDAKAKSRTILGDRGAYVSLSGERGTLFLGRGSSAIRGLWGSIGDVSGLPVVSGISTGGVEAEAKARVIYGDTYSNYVAYSSPVFNGFSASVALAPKQDLATGVGDNDANKDTTSFTVQYANGPVAAAANITDQAQTGGAKVTTLLASYDLGVVKAAVTTQSIDMNDGSTNPGNGTVFTVSAPLGSGVLGGGFGKRSNENSAIGDDVKQTFIGYKYMFSKRTAVSAVYNKIDRDGATSGTTNDLKETHLIVSHTF